MTLLTLPIYPAKTDQAREALRAHSGPLAPRERQLLILCNGERRIDELAAMAGGEIDGLIARLCAAGFLSAVDGSPSVAAAQECSEPCPPIPTCTWIGRATASPEPAAERPAALTSPGMAAANSKRSIAAAKMYMLGILELQRHPGAIIQRMDLNRQREPEAIFEHIVRSVAWLQKTAKPTYVAQVRQRLSEVLPEGLLEPNQTTTVARNLMV